MGRWGPTTLGCTYGLAAGGRLQARLCSIVHTHTPPKRFHGPLQAPTCPRGPEPLRPRARHEAGRPALWPPQPTSPQRDGAPRAVDARPRPRRGERARGGGVVPRAPHRGRPDNDERTAAETCEASGRLHWAVDAAVTCGGRAFAPCGGTPRLQPEPLPLLRVEGSGLAPRSACSARQRGSGRVPRYLLRHAVSIKSGDSVLCTAAAKAACTALLAAPSRAQVPHAIAAPPGLLLLPAGAGARAAGGAAQPRAPGAAPRLLLLGDDAAVVEVPRRR